MKGGSLNPFRRAKAMFAAIGAAIKAFRNDVAGLRDALGAIGPYKDGKRKPGSRRHPARTTRRDQRAARKKRNRQRNKLAHRRHGK